MKRAIITILVVLDILIIIAAPGQLVVQFFFVFPFLFLYFIYRLIKSLMKYHHDLKNEDRTNKEKQL